MTIVRNPNYVEGAAVESRIGWWRFRDEAYARRGKLDAHTRKPVEPLLLIEGDHPGGGEFLGWENNIANCCDGFEVVSTPVPRADGLALLTSRVPGELWNFRQIPEEISDDVMEPRLEQAQSAGIIPRTASAIEEVYDRAIEEIPDDAMAPWLASLQGVVGGLGSLADALTADEARHTDRCLIGEGPLPEPDLTRGGTVNDPRPHSGLSPEIEEAYNRATAVCDQAEAELLVLGVCPTPSPEGEPSSLPPHPHDSEQVVLDPAWMREALKEIFDLAYKCERGGVKETTFFSKLRNMAEEFDERTKKRFC